MKFATSLTLALLASVSSVLATPVPEAEPAESIAKRACTQSRACFGINRTAHCYDHCREECGKSGGKCGGAFWQYCHCYSH